MQEAVRHSLGKTTREIFRMSTAEFSAFTDEFSELLYEMPFQVPEDLIMLGRCVSILSGMATGLDPDFNVWKACPPCPAAHAEGTAAPAGAWR